MNPKKSLNFPAQFTYGAITFFIVAGIVARFYHIARNDFFFFDEGLYLNLHRKYLELIANVQPHSLHNIWGAFYLCVRLALGEGKALWFLISHIRVFFGGLEMWYFPRVVSALAGALTLWAVYYFAKNFFKSKKIGWISVVILAVLPSHVFYSRLALQETLCTLLFLTGLYYYMAPRRFGSRTFISSVILGLAYFLNYRLIVLPLLVFFCEMALSFSEGTKSQWRKYLWHSLVFLSMVFLIGDIDQAQNTVVTFAWMFYQARLGKESFDVFNFLSYPYYLFRLEGFFVGFLFFGNIYFYFKREWKRLVPFALVLFHMAIFSFAGDKGARYLCVMLPFVAVAIASLLEYLLKEYTASRYQTLILGIFAVIMVMLLSRSVEIARIKNDYQTSIEYLKTLNPHPMIVSTQPHIQNLYTDPKNVFNSPRSFDGFIRLYHSGFHYLIIDPQAYVSRTINDKKFEPRLLDYLNFIRENIVPLREFPHFNDLMLERFVFEHNENLRRSIAFLANFESEHFGTLRVFDMKTCIDTVNDLVRQRTERKNAPGKNAFAF